MRYLYLCVLVAVMVVWPAAAQTVPTGARLVTTHSEAGAASFVYQPADALIFSTPTGTQTASLPGPLLAVQPSRDGAFIGVMAAENAATADRAGIVFQVYRHEGTRGYEHRVAYRPDEPHPVFALNDRSGAIAYGYPATGEVVMLDENGQERHRLRLFDDAAYALERSLLLAFSADGSTLAVAAMREPAHPDRSGISTNADLLVFRADGTLRWRRALPQQALHALAISDDGRWIGVSTYDAYAPDGIAWQSQLFTPAGDEVLNAPIGFATMRVADEAPVALLIDKRGATAYDLRDGRIRYSMTPPETSPQILDAVLRPDGDAAVVLLGDVAWESSGFVYRALQARRLDAAGRTVGTQVWQAAQHHAPRLAQPTNAKTVQVFMDAELETIGWE